MPFERTSQMAGAERTIGVRPCGFSRRTARCADGLGVFVQAAIRAEERTRRMDGQWKDSARVRPSAGHSWSFRGLPEPSRNPAGGVERAGVEPSLRIDRKSARGCVPDTRLVSWGSVCGALMSFSLPCPGHRLAGGVPGTRTSYRATPEALALAARKDWQGPSAGETWRPSGTPAEFQHAGGRATESSPICECAAATRVFMDVRKGALAGPSALPDRQEKPRIAVTDVRERRMLALCAERLLAMPMLAGAMPILAGARPTLQNDRGTYHSVDGGERPAPIREGAWKKPDTRYQGTVRMYSSSRAAAGVPDGGTSSGPSKAAPGRSRRGMSLRGRGRSFSRTGAARAVPSIPLFSGARTRPSPRVGRLRVRI